MYKKIEVLPGNNTDIKMIYFFRSSLQRILQRTQNYSIQNVVFFLEISYKLICNIQNIKHMLLHI